MKDLHQQPNHKLPSSGDGTHDSVICHKKLLFHLSQWLPNNNRRVGFCTNGCEQPRGSPGSTPWGLFLLVCFVYAFRKIWAEGMDGDFHQPGWLVTPWVPRRGPIPCRAEMVLYSRLTSSCDSIWGFKIQTFLGERRRNKLSLLLDPQKAHSSNLHV